MARDFQKGIKKHKKVQILDKDEFNNLLNLAECTKSELLIYKEGQDIQADVDKYGLTHYAYVKFCPKNVRLFFKKNGESKGCEYVFTLDGNETCLDKGSDMYAKLRRGHTDVIVNFEEMSDKLKEITLGYIGKSGNGKFMCKHAGILWYNPKFNRIPTHFYSYDINSAYASCIYDEIPYTRDASGYFREVQEGEVGFIFGDSLTVTRKGFADVIFKMVKTPDNLRSWLKMWFDRKTSSQVGAKECLTWAFGYLQYTNPYLRAYIIETCNKKMKDMIDNETTILINTDCIYSTVKLDFMKLGTNIGEYKEDEGIITIRKYDYKIETSTKVKEKFRGKTHPIYKVVNNRIEVI